MQVIQKHLKWPKRQDGLLERPNARSGLPVSVYRGGSWGGSRGAVTGVTPPPGILLVVLVLFAPFVISQSCQMGKTASRSFELSFSPHYFSRRHVLFVLRHLCVCHVLELIAAISMGAFEQRVRKSEGFSGNHGQRWTRSRRWTHNGHDELAAELAKADELATAKDELAVTKGELAATSEQAGTTAIERSGTTCGGTAVGEC